jgi:hypothetical protein
MQPPGTPQADCQYSDRTDGAWRCPLPALPGSTDHHCIMHEVNPEKSAEDFEQALRKMLEIQYHDFRGYVFPRAVAFDGHDFAPGAIFSNARFLGKASFKGCSLGTQASFEGAEFLQPVEFDRATSDCANFKGASFRNRSHFGHCEFGYTTFESVHFAGEAEFMGSLFRSRSVWDDARFDSRAGFTDTTFRKSASFARCHFGGDAEFWDAFFGGEFEIVETQFHKRLFLHGARFGMYLLIRDASIPDRSDLLYTLKRAETQFRQHGWTRPASDLFLQQQQIIRRSLPWTRPRKYLHFALFGLCGYGERPFWLLAWWGGLICAFAAVFSCYHTPPPSTCSLQALSASLRLSILTFTTAGIGTWPLPYDSPIWTFICLESLLGAIMIALFVMTLGRKMMGELS